MIDKWLTKIIDFIFPHQESFDGNERTFWNNHWNEMIEYYKKHDEIFEINDKWDFYCNKALHNHYKSIVGSLEKLSCIECGCGGSYESTLMAKEGAKVTILDYSEKALEYAKIVSQRVGVLDKVGFICEDIFNFTQRSKYGLAWNCGVTEHYQNDEIIKIIKKMMLFCEKDGLIVITIPNLLSPQSIYLMLKDGKGSEKYLSHRKLKVLMKKSGLKNVQIKNLNYWLPSFLPYSWAIKTSKYKILNNLKCLTWLFSGVGVVN